MCGSLQVNVEELQSKIKTQETELTKLNQRVSALTTDMAKQKEEQEQSAAKLKQVEEEAEKKLKESTSASEKKIKEMNEENEKNKNTVADLNNKLQEVSN